MNFESDKSTNDTTYANSDLNNRSKVLLYTIGYKLRHTGSYVIMDHSPFKLNLHFCKKNQNLLPQLEIACQN